MATYTIQKNTSTASPVTVGSDIVSTVVVTNVSQYLVHSTNSPQTLAPWVQDTATVEHGDNGSGVSGIFLRNVGAIAALPLTLEHSSSSLDIIQFLGANVTTESNANFRIRIYDGTDNTGNLVLNVTGDVAGGANASPFTGTDVYVEVERIAGGTGIGTEFFIQRLVVREQTNDIVNVSDPVPAAPAGTTRSWTAVGSSSGVNLPGTSGTGPILHSNFELPAGSNVTYTITDTVNNVGEYQNVAEAVDPDLPGQTPVVASGAVIVVQAAEAAGKASGTITCPAVCSTNEAKDLPANPPLNGPDAGATTNVGIEIAFAPLGCTVDGNGDVNGRVYTAETVPDETGGTPTYRMVHVDTSGTVTDPYTGAWVDCPTGQGVRSQVFAEAGCADGVPYSRRHVQTFDADTGAAIAAQDFYVNSAGAIATVAPANFTLGACPGTSSAQTLRDFEFSSSEQANVENPVGTFNNILVRQREDFTRTPAGVETTNTVTQYSDDGSTWSSTAPTGTIRLGEAPTGQYVGDICYDIGGRDQLGVGGIDSGRTLRYENLGPNEDRFFEISSTQTGGNLNILEQNPNGFFPANEGLTVDNGVPPTPLVMTFGPVGTLQYAEDIHPIRIGVHDAEANGELILTGWTIAPTVVSGPWSYNHATRTLRSNTPAGTSHAVLEFRAHPTPISFSKAGSFNSTFQVNWVEFEPDRRQGYGLLNTTTGSTTYYDRETDAVIDFALDNVNMTRCNSDEVSYADEGGNGVSVSATSAVIGRLSATTSGTVATGKQSVTFVNVGTADATVLGQTLSAGEDVTYTAYMDPVESLYRRLPAIAYTASATANLRISWVD